MAIVQPPPKNIVPKTHGKTHVQEFPETRNAVVLDFDDIQHLLDLPITLI